MRSGFGDGEFSLITIRPPELGLAATCEPIMRALPDWFGIEAANQQYVRDIEVNPTLLAVVANQVVGFLTLVIHTEYAAEIHIIGVLQEHHRQGVGRALVTAAESYLRSQQVEYLQVKTLSARDPDAGYQRTRLFYLGMGFRPLQEFPDLWDKENPCLQLIKYIAPER